MRRSCRLACVLAFLCLVSPAAAEPVDDSTRQTARALGYAGVRDYQSGNYLEARTKLDKAYQVLRAPSLGLWSARTLVKLGKWVAAVERYREISKLDPSGGNGEAVQRKAQSDAATELAVLVVKVPTLLVEFEGAEPTQTAISIDGNRLPSQLISEKRPVDPGSHHVEATAGNEHVANDTVVAEGENKTVRLRFSHPAAAAPLSPSPSPTPMREATHELPPSEVEKLLANDAPASAQPTPSSDRTLGWVAMGVGAGALAASGVTAALASGKKGSGCVDNRCPSADLASIDAYNNLRAVSTVAFWAGAGLATTGIVLVLAAPRSSSRSTVAVRLSPDAALVTGTF